MTIYEFFTNYIMIYFIDLSVYQQAEEIFYWIFFGVSTLIVVFVFVWMPMSFFRWICNGCKKKGRFL